ncbi:MAG: VOC family protein [Chloroflexi bacterium]|nr:VOC family protein [Chloroflexota bacterium]
MFERMDHAAISVRDMDKAIAFYGDVIGMQKTFDRTFDEPMARIIGIPGTRVRIVHMRLGESVVELFDYQYPHGREPQPDRIQADFGMTHIGFMVKDFEATYKQLLDKGVRFLSEPVEIRPNVWVAYFHGAEYEICEMREIKTS